MRQVAVAGAIQEGKPNGPKTPPTMLIPLVFVSIFCVGLGSAAEGIQYKAYNLRAVPVTAAVVKQLKNLSRCSNSGYGYSYSRYPSSYYGGGGGFNLGSLVGPLVFGLAAAGGLALLTSALSGVSIGK